MSVISIAGRSIGPDYPPFIIAEAGINHNGDAGLALEMVRLARKCGCDAIKFQTFKASEFVGDPKQTFTYRSQGREVTEPMLEMFRRNELSATVWQEIKAECDRQDIMFLSTPQNRSDLDFLLTLGIPAIKVGSDDFTNLPLLRSYAKERLPMIVSCGMADMAEVHRSLEAIGALDGAPTVLLLCTSQYPTPPADVNLAKLATLRAAFPGLTLGFSDHTVGPLASALAAALGACLFEKHFTLGHDLAGPDHWFSETPATLGEWVTAIRTAKVMLGSPMVRPTDAEREMRKLARRSVVATRKIVRGDVLSMANLGLLRPGTGLSPDMLDLVIGGVVTRDIAAGEPLRLWDISYEQKAQ